MIVDRRVLDDEYVPRVLRHRDGEMSEFASAFRPLVHDREPQHVLLFGESGTGKTCLANYATQAFEHDPGTPFAITSLYIDCWEDNTRFQLLYRVVSEFDPFVPEAPATDRWDFLEWMEAYDGPHFVVILDEAELLRDPHIIRDYHNRDGFSIVLIASDRDEFFASWPTSEVNRLTGPRITLRQYPLDALVSILEDRVEEALVPGAVDTPQLRTIANHAAGDAQRAITILRTAAYAADDRGARGITDEMIESATDRAGDLIQQKRLDRFTRQQRIIYDVVMEAGESLSVSEVFRRYSEQLSDETDLRSNKQVRRYLKKLAEYNLIGYSGNTSARVYHPPE